MAEPTVTNKVETNSETTTLSHKKKKALWKKQKRKIKRQAEAQERDEKVKREEELKKNSPSYEQKLAKEEEQKRRELLQMEAESQRQRELWEWHEEMYKQRLKQKEEQAEREKQQKLEIEKKIKEEWEERQKKEKEEEEEKRKKKEKQVNHIERWGSITHVAARDFERAVLARCFQGFHIVKDEEELLKQAREAENKDGDWSNPLAPVQYGKERQIETCPFFAKVAACRFGDRCSRSHPYPENSRTLLFSSMFRHFQLDQGLCEEYDTDIVLEYEDSEVYQKFKEFYEDTLPEFKAIGHVVQFKVCCNFQPHLRGNVYVSYSREDHALEAYTKFNARWYGGKQISAQFVEIPSWRRAICGLFGKGRCPKGKECNFLHVFKNPSGEFNMADRDMEPFTPRQDYYQRHQRSRERRYSPSRSSRKYRHSRSRSRERHNSHRFSSRYSRHRSRSTDRQRSYSSRHRSRSPDYRSRSTRNRSRTPEHRSNSFRQRSRSPYKKSRSHRSKVSKYKDRSRSESEESSRENSPVDETFKDNSNKVSTAQPTVSVDNIENYEQSVDNSDEMVWVEKTKENLNKNGTNRNYRAHSPSVENDTEKSRRGRSNSNSDNDDDSYKKKHKKSKKHKRSKES